MEQPGSIQQMTETIQNTWTTWEAMIRQVDQEKFNSPGAAGEWSLKDIIAHITWHEKEMVRLVEAHALVGSELRNLPTDERNTVIYVEVRDLPLEQVLADSTQVHQQLLDALPSLSDADLTDPTDFTNMPPDWQPWLVIAQNTYEHYQDHIKDVELWLAE